MIENGMVIAECSECLTMIFAPSKLVNEIICLLCLKSGVFSEWVTIKALEYEPEGGQ